MKKCPGTENSEVQVNLIIATSTMNLSFSGVKTRFRLLVSMLTSRPLAIFVCLTMTHKPLTVMPPVLFVKLGSIMGMFLTLLEI